MVHRRQNEHLLRTAERKRGLVFVLDHRMDFHHYATTSQTEYRCQQYQFSVG